MDHKFLGEKLRLARLLNGLTLKELGDAVTASRQFIHQLEGDIRQPSEDILYALCEVLSVKESFFYKKLGNDVKFEQCHFRKRKTTPISLANRVCAYSSLFEELVSFLSEYLDFPELNIPEYINNESSYSNLEIETAAENCRKKWGLGLDAPIGNMTNILENQGVVITTFTGVSAKVDALSINRKHPIIIRNDAKESPCRLRFDLAHECGHFVLHNGVETGDTVTESEADKFASALLFPRSSFTSEFPKSFTGRGKHSWEPLYELKKRWGVSIKSILYRAHYLKIISSQQYRSANIWLSTTKQTKTEWHDDKIELETPSLLQSSISILDEELGISFSKIANHLNITTTMLSQITGIDVPKDSAKNNIEIFFKK